MKLIELYNLKLNEFRNTGLKDKPSKLLALLLLSEKSKYEPLEVSNGDFYKKYKLEIDEKISQVEKDFNFSREEIINIIEETSVCDNFRHQKIWFVFAEGFGALHWGLLYRPLKSGEEIYSEYFDNEELRITLYDTEQMAIANNIAVTHLDDILNNILEKPRDFYEKVCECLTPEERMFILQNLKNKCCANCLNGCCQVESHEKIGLDERGFLQGHDCIGWYNSALIGKSKVLRRNDISSF